jgi:tape measure domain-containing protein
LIPSLRRTATALGAGFVAFKAFQFGKDAVIDFNAQLEQSRIAFATVLHSGRAADTLLRQLGQFAKTTPFEFQELVPLSQRLLATGTSAKDVIPQLTLLGDTVSALGGSSVELEQLIRATSQLRARGKANLGDLYQITNLGIPIFQKMAEKTGQSVGKLMESISKGEVPAQVALDALFTAARRDYGGAMERQSHTFTGAMSNIHDAIQLTLAQAFRPLFDTVSEGAQRFSDFLGSADFQTWSQNTGRDIASVTEGMINATAAVGGFTAENAGLIETGVKIGGIGLAAVGAAKLVNGLVSAVQSVQLAILAMRTAPLLAVNPWALAAGAAVAGLGAAFLLTGDNTDSMSDALDRAKRATDDLADAMRDEHDATLDVRQAHLDVKNAADRYSEAQERVNKLTRDGKKGTEEYRDAVRDVDQASIDLARAQDREVDASKRQQAARNDQRRDIRRVEQAYIDAGQAARRNAAIELHDQVRGMNASSAARLVATRATQDYVKGLRQSIDSTINNMRANQNASSAERDSARRKELIALAALHIAQRTNDIPTRRQINIFMREHPAALRSELQGIKGDIDNVEGNHFVNIIQRIFPATAPAQSLLPPRVLGQKGPNTFAGGHNLPAGFRTVGERGMEAMFVPQGADIFTASETRNILRALAGGVGRLADVRPVHIAQLHVTTPNAGTLVSDLNRLAWGSR